jgi:uncharacterized membrane protein
MVAVSVNEWTLIISVISVALGFVSNAVQTGSFLGIETVPKKWLPYLTLIGTFLAAFLQSISTASPVTGTAVLQAVIAGFTALTGTAVGVTIHQHLTVAPQDPANDNGAEHWHKKKRAA